MPKIMIEVSDTPHGVKVDVRGDLGSQDSACYVARGMVIYAGALFVEAKPVLLAGDADPVQLRQGPGSLVVARCNYCGALRETWNSHE